MDSKPSKKKLAICIPTYNRPDEIKEIIESEFHIIKNNDIDLYIYDSSENDLTRNLIFRDSNLIYIKIDSSISSNVKVFDIYKNLHEKYEYLWVSHDHTIFSDEAILYVLNTICGDGDYYFLRASDANSVCAESDMSKFLFDSAWLSTKYGTAIINAERFFSTIDWDRYEKKYLQKEKINFSHIGLYYERMVEIDCPKIYSINLQREYFKNLHIGRKIGWYQDVIRICLQTWCENIMNLPDEYGNKKEVILTQDKCFLSKYSLFEYRMNNVYGLTEFLKYRKYFSMMLSGFQYPFWIAVMPKCLLRNYVAKEVVDAIKYANRNGLKVCIYGAGKHGMECYEFLCNMNYKIDAFLITNAEGNGENINEVPICSAKKYIERNQTLVIIAVASETVDEVDKYLKNECDNSNVKKSICFM